AAVLGQRIVVAIVLADAVTERPIGAGNAELLDPAVLVGWHRLAGHLPADPVVFLRHHHGASAAERAERRRHATKAAADDGDICRVFFQLRPLSWWKVPRVSPSIGSQASSTWSPLELSSIRSQSICVARRA